MKNFRNLSLTVLLVLSILCNAILIFNFLNISKPSPSIIKLSFGEHDTVIYCEKSDDIKNVRVDTNKNTYTIGNAKISYTEDAVYLSSLKKRINLSAYDGFGFIVNSNGELLYSLNVPCKKSEKVYITPSGKKYHRDPHCAGKTGFEINVETAKLVREPCSLCA